ncbi:MAG: PCMD domain-containing protein [Muribaculaceae bacterium]|nr:PCMD domain-containing protein [Muribaculaceae bacterium]
MKKLFISMLAAVTAIAALATNYTGTLTVTVNGESSNSESTISVVQNGNDYTLSINNFELDDLPIGNIVVTAPGTTNNGLTSIVTSQDITITAGDEGDDEWIGPMLGVVPINMVLAFNDYAMTTNIDIYMAELEQNINVKFTQDGELTGYQIKNSGFENFKDNGEPLAWHGFKSASGTLAGSAKGTLGASDDVRSGATGKSAVITSGSTFGIVNNGTMTTGQLNAGNISATHPANHSHMDISSTAVDQNGDPFYTIMHGRPDAIKFWMKFTQGTAQNTYKYATISAIITDGTYYQDPEDDDYTNKLATAKNNTIETCDWSEFTVPFNYIDESINGQALLVTISTNATPGKGSNGDKVFVDDIALVYNAAITGITIKGQALEGFSQDVTEYNFDLAEGETIADSDIAATYVSSHAYLVKKVVDTRDCYKAFVAVISNDLNTVKVYTINFLKPATSLANILKYGENGNEYIVGNELAIATDFELVDGDTKKVGATDIMGNYVALIVPADFDGETVASRDLIGTYNVENGNPVITTSYIKKFNGEQISYLKETFNLSYIDQNGFNVKPTQIIYLKGYGDADGKLRSYRNYPQGTSIALNNLSGITIQPGNLYTMYGMMTLNEAWESEEQGIMPKIKPSDPRYFDNYTFIAVSGEETIVTGIDGIDAAGRQVEAIYNAQGQRVNENATGILIIRYTDGTVTKVVKH